MKSWMLAARAAASTSGWVASTRGIEQVGEDRVVEQVRFLGHHADVRGERIRVAHPAGRARRCRMRPAWDHTDGGSGR